MAEKEPFGKGDVNRETGERRDVGGEGEGREMGKGGGAQDLRRGEQGREGQQGDMKRNQGKDIGGGDAQTE